MDETKGSFFKKINPVYRILIISVLVFIALFFLAQMICVNSKYTAEAGTDCPAERFVRIDFGNCEYAGDSEFFDPAVPGTYMLRIRNGLFIHTCRLTIIDSIDPKIGLCDVVIGMGKKVEAADFVDSINDATDCTVTYKGTGPDYDLTDQVQQVEITVTDAGGNQVDASANLTILPIEAKVDVPLFSDPPVIEDFVAQSVLEAEGDVAAFAGDPALLDYGTPGVYPIDIIFRGVQYTVEIGVVDVNPPVFSEASDRIIALGDTVAFKNLVEATDDSGSCEITFDANEVDTTKLGTYPITYTAVDESGNESSIVINVTVTDYTADEQELYDKVDEILKSITTDDMDAIAKARAIYDYVTKHVTYTVDSPRSDTVTEALQGLEQSKGDCHVYASLSEVMLTRAGILNKRIERVSEDSSHDWNLIDINDGHGWYHFDTTPRTDHPVIFMWDDEKLREYSDAHGGSHDYDRETYPDIP